MKTPRKHAELIKAWADGHEIEYLDLDGIWKLIKKPSWVIETEYRIKPEVKQPVVRWLWSKSNGFCTISLYSDDECKQFFGDKFPIKLEWSRTEFPE